MNDAALPGGMHLLCPTLDAPAATVSHIFPPARSPCLLPFAQITGHELRRVLPNAGAQQIVVSAADLDAADGSLALTAPGPHPFSGGKQLVEVGGLGEALDGLHAVWSSGPGKPVTVNAGKRAVGAADDVAVRASVERGEVAIK